MLVVAGVVGLGLVWGWIAARLVYRARRWTLFATALLGLIAQALFVARLGPPRATLWFAAAVAIGALLATAWLRTIEARLVN
jgi:hypothetical protein